MRGRARLVRGTDLTPEQRSAVLRAFTYRPTTENARGYPYPRNPTGARVAPTTDDEWLAAHAFYIRVDGKLAHLPKHCEPAYLADNL